MKVTIELSTTTRAGQPDVAVRVVSDRIRTEYSRPRDAAEALLEALLASWGLPAGSSPLLASHIAAPTAQERAA